jgi:hypothetical protein
MEGRHCRDMEERSQTSSATVTRVLATVEASICTHNAWHQRLITVFGSHTMQKYLWNLSLEWSDPQCEYELYAALNDTDHIYFRRL